MFTRDDGKTHYNRTASNKECSSGGYHCVEKGPGGPGYIKYCPVDASFSPKTFKSGVSNQDRCYLSNDLIVDQNTPKKSWKMKLKDVL